MVGELVGGALMVTGGGLLSLSSLSLAAPPRRWSSPYEFGAGLADALADTAHAPVPIGLAELLDQLP